MRISEVEYDIPIQLLVKIGGVPIKPMTKKQKTDVFPREAANGVGQLPIDLLFIITIYLLI